MYANRSNIIYALVFISFGVVGWRLYDLMVHKHERLQERAWKQQLDTRQLNENRGLIYDRKGRKLVVNIDTYAVSANPREVKDIIGTARSLASVTGEPYEDIQRKLASGKGFVWIKRKLDFESGRRLAELKLPGVSLKPDVRRSYPRNEYGVHVLGFLNVDDEARDGVERSYDRYLRGEGKEVVVEVDRWGKSLSSGTETESWGNGVVLTIDYGLQVIVEQALREGIERNRAKAGAAIMMDPYTGEILSMANWPTFNPNLPGQATEDGWKNRAVTDTFEPGSTFKVVAAAAALEQNVVSPETTFNTGNGTIRVADKVIRDTHHKQSVMSMRDIIKHSSNVGTILMSRRISRDSLHSYMNSFGFGRKTGIDLPAEHAGVLRPLKYWSDTSHAAMSIGYEVGVTPIQVVRAYAAIANGGLLVTPHVVSRVVAPTGETIERISHAEPERVVSERTAIILRDLLKGVTTEDGTGSAASVKGDDVAGKTGTTRVYDAERGEYSTTRYVSSFVGFLPADSPKVALIVVIFEPQGKEYYGGQVAAPVFGKIAEHAMSYLNIAPTHEDKDQLMVKFEGAER